MSYSILPKPSRPVPREVLTDPQLNEWRRGEGKPRMELLYDYIGFLCWVALAIVIACIAVIALKIVYG